MNLELAAVIAEIVSAFAVVATLIFLAIELRNNRDATRSSALDSLASGFNATSAQIFSDPGLTDIWLKGMEDPEALNELERTQLVLMVQSYVNTYTSVRKYHESGALPNDEWLVYSKGMAGFMNTPGGYWLRENIAITPSVIAEFDKYKELGERYAYVRQAK